LNVIPFEPIPNEFLIDSLESLLHQALTGELQSIAYALVFADKNTGNGWAGLDKSSMSVVAEIEILKQEVIDNYIEMRHQREKT